jgi:hypothetical protein
VSGPDAFDDEMTSFFPPSRLDECDEPLLGMLFERRPLPPGAPTEMHELAQMFATLNSPAQPGELAGEAEALAAFRELPHPAGTWPKALRPRRRRLSRSPARIRANLAAALIAAVAAIGGAVAAYGGVLPGPVQGMAHVMVGAPAPHYRGPHRPARPGSPRDMQHTLRPASQPGMGKSHPRGAATAPADVQVPGSRHRPGGHGRMTASCCPHTPPAQNPRGKGTSHSGKPAPQATCCTSSAP